MHILVLGATSAIAQALCHQLSQKQSSDFTLIGRNSERLQSCKLHLTALGAHAVECVMINLSTVENITETINKAIELNGPIDIAILAQGSLTDQVRAQTDFIYLIDEFSLNAMSMIVSAQCIANHFKEKGKGTLIAIGSVAGERGRKGNYLYGSAKSAVHTFLSGIRNDIANDDIHIMTIKPGFVSTPMTSNLKQNALFVTPEFVAREILRGMEQDIDVMYIPSYWRIIMMIIRALPEKLFMKLHI